MARPRGFDEKTAVDRATDVFWRKGYHATSTRDLGEALDLNPSSLYRTFGDKHRLFLRALEHYQANESTDGRERFRSARPTKDALVKALTFVALGDDTQASEPAGCFAVNTAAELGGTDEEISRRTEAAFDLTRAGLTDLLTRMRDSGALSKDSKPEALTDLLFTLIVGWRLRAKAGHRPKDIQNSIRQAVSILT